VDGSLWEDPIIYQHSVNGVENWRPFFKSVCLKRLLGWKFKVKN